MDREEVIERCGEELRRTSVLLDDLSAELSVERTENTALKARLERLTKDSAAKDRHIASLNEEVRHLLKQLSPNATPRGAPSAALVLNSDETDEEDAADDRIRTLSLDWNQSTTMNQIKLLNFGDTVLSGAAMLRSVSDSVSSTSASDLADECDACDEEEQARRQEELMSALLSADRAVLRELTFTPARQLACLKDVSIHSSDSLLRAIGQRNLNARVSRLGPACSFGDQHVVELVKSIVANRSDLRRAVLCTGWTTPELCEKLSWMEIVGTLVDADVTDCSALQRALRDGTVLLDDDNEPLFSVQIANTLLDFLDDDCDPTDDAASYYAALSQSMSASNKRSSSRRLTKISRSDDDMKTCRGSRESSICDAGVTTVWPFLVDTPNISTDIMDEVCE